MLRSFHRAMQTIFALSLLTGNIGCGQSFKPAEPMLANLQAQDMDLALNFLKINPSEWSNLSDAQIVEKIKLQIQGAIDILQLTSGNEKTIRSLRNFLSRLDSDAAFRVSLINQIRQIAGGPSPTPSPTPSPIPSPTPVPTPNPTPMPSPSPSPSPTPSPSPNPTPAPSPSPTPTVQFPASGCSGSGLSYACAAGATATQVQSAINGAADGAVITFQSGQYSWSSWIQYSAAKGSTLICQSVGSCVVSTGSTMIGMNGTVSGTNQHFYRFSGFKVNTTGTNPIIWFTSAWPGGSGVMSRLRIDHNTLNGPDGLIAIMFGDNSSLFGYYYGVVDHNTLRSPGSAMFVMWLGGHSDPNAPTAPRGTAYNMFVEDNVIINDVMTNAGKGCSDSWGGANIVFRYNTFRNCLVATHGSLHAGGPQNWEFYGNTGVLDSGSSGSGVEDGYRMFHHQGSGMLTTFNNTYTAFSGKNSDSLAIMYYRDDVDIAASEGGTVCDGNNNTVFEDGKRDGNRSPTSAYHGYPCWHQPARDFAGNLQPMYAWNNKYSDGTKVNLTFEQYGVHSPYHVMPDRDIFNAVGGVQVSPTSPFNGSTGMGFGTLANRPTTCSVGKTDAPDAGKGGVGYFATDVGPQGTLYQCSSQNYWIEYYKPYSYPHPLVSGQMY